MENTKKYQFLSNLPDRKNRYVIVDTETTGLNQKKDNIIEIAAIEIENGELTGNQFHGYLKARTFINKFAEEKHKISRDFYDIHINGYFKSDKNIMANFLKFVGDSMIFAHNATFDLAFINRELEYWNLSTIPLERFRCTMRIAKQIFKDVKNDLYKKCSLKNCCDYFNIVTDSNSLHNALYDCTLTGKLLSKIYVLLDENIKEEEFSLILSRVSDVSLHQVNVVEKKYRDEFNDVDEDIETLEKILEEMKIQSKPDLVEQKTCEINKDVGISKRNDCYVENKRENVSQLDSKKDVYKSLMKNFISTVDNKNK